MQSELIDSSYQSGETIDQVLLFIEHESRILISREHVFQPHVRAALGRLKAKYPDRLIKEEKVGMEEIERKRSETSMASPDGQAVYDTSEMQRVALDLFSKAVEMRASDLHIRVDKYRTEVLFRINNDLTRIAQHPTAWGKSLCQTIYHTLADVSDATFEEGNRQDARIGNRRSLPEALDGIRIATTPQIDGYLMVLRMLYDASGVSIDLCDLGFTPTQRARVTFIKKRQTGITLVTGPTGSGKSTTLQRVLTGLIRETEGKKNVITVEDPPEYPIPGAVQTPVTNAPTEEARSIAFQQAIKAALRVDPDVIMIGEIRDTPSARLAFQAAMTGHQVWSTLHANGAFHAADRLTDLGIPKEIMTDPTILSGLMSQRLLKTLCSCKRPLREVYKTYLETNPEFEDDFGRMVEVFKDDIHNIQVKGDGCEKCRFTGITGRVVVAEVVVTDRPLLDLMRAGDKTAALDYWREKHEGMTMVEHTILKSKQGIVDPFLSEATVGPLDGGNFVLTYKRRQTREKYGV